MAQLKDLIVTGTSKFINDVITNKIQITKLAIPTSSGGSTYGAGTDGQVIKTNGTSIYWATLGTAAAKAVDTSISTASTSANLPTSAAVASFVEGKGYITSAPSPTSTIPMAGGIAATGTETAYARGDHVHPKELPTISSTDDGKSLVVYNGAWNAVFIEPRGLQNADIQTIYLTIDSSGNISIDNSSELNFTDFTKKKNTILVINDTYVLFAYASRIESFYVPCYQSDVFPLDALGYYGYMGYISIDFFGDNGYSAYLNKWKIEELPSVTSADNGKVLMVVDGAWEKASLLNANGVSF